jgi:hypothetical protein
MDQHDLTHLNGQSVLVKSSVDHRDPPIALRGTIEARSSPAGKPEVKIVLEYPDMNNTAARRGVIDLDRAGIDRLMAGEHDGVYDYTIDRPLEPGPEPRGPQAVS